MNFDTKHTMTGAVKNSYFMNVCETKRSPDPSDILFIASDSFDENLYTGKLRRVDDRFTVVSDERHSDCIDFRYLEAHMNDNDETPLKMPKD